MWVIRAYALARISQQFFDEEVNMSLSGWHQKAVHAAALKTFSPPSFIKFEVPS